MEESGLSSCVCRHILVCTPRRLACAHSYMHQCAVHVCVCLSEASKSRHNLHALSPGKAEQAFLSPWTARQWKTDL